MEETVCSDTYSCIWALGPVFVRLPHTVCLTPPPASTFILCFLCVGHYSKHFIYCLGLVGALNPHFTDEEPASERLRNLPKFTPLVNRRAGIWTSSLAAKTLCFITVLQHCTIVRGVPASKAPDPNKRVSSGSHQDTCHMPLKFEDSSDLWRDWTRATAHPRGRWRERGHFNSRLRLLRD